MSKALFCVSERHRGVGPGDEVDLEVDADAAEGVDITGDITAAAGAPWPPRIVEMELRRSGKRAIAKIGRDVDNEALFGPRLDELLRVLERLEAITWLTPRETHEELLDVLAPRVDAFVRGLQRSGTVPPMKATITGSFAEVRACGHRVTRVPGIARAVADDGATRSKRPRAEGACLAGFAAISRVVGRLAEPLFQGAVIDFAAEPDAAALIRFFGATPPPVAERARIAHDALAQLPSAVPRLILDTCIQVGASDGQGIWLPQLRVAERLVEQLRVAYPIEDHTNEEVVIASAALQLAWNATANLLNEMLYGLTCHVASLVIRPKGSFDLWAPWVEMMAIGLPVFGLYLPGRLSFFAKRPS
ncbi:MAG: hypothetical protein ABIO72_02555 [Patescibacteria group bacterium]